MNITTETLEKELNLQGKTQKELERQLLKSMAGNYKVTFKFAETFSPVKHYKYHDRHFSQAKEVVLLLEETENKISLQHLLYVGKNIIKHWRQDWIYENREFLQLVQNHRWKKVAISEEKAKGTWTQKVYQVDDCPRYEGYGTWVHVDGRHFWESTADAALPRREISTEGRTDYNVLRRHSHIELFEDGSWLIEQDNEKLMRTESGEDTLVCLEKGLERFTPKNYDPKKAVELWDDQKDFWAEVRDIWAEIIESRDEINIENDEKLYMAQFELSKQYEGGQYDRNAARKAIKDRLNQHLTK